MISTFTVACFLASVVLFAAACVLAWWSWDERKYIRRLQRRLRLTEQQRDDASRRLDTYRQWAGDLNWAVRPTPEDQEQ